MKRFSRQAWTAAVQPPFAAGWLAGRNAETSLWLSSWCSQFPAAPGSFTPFHPILRNLQLEYAFKKSPKILLDSYGLRRSTINLSLGRFFLVFAPKVGKPQGVCG